HLLTLCRLGITRFHIADFDIFELGNFNRHIGATISSIERPKAQVLYEMAKNINPNVDIKVFEKGVDAQNVNDFLDGVDIYIDGLDFFVLDVRLAVFGACHQRGIPSLTAAPLGMGTAYLTFLPGNMSFNEYFDL